MNRKIEFNISLTARMACLKRAMSYNEKNKNYHSDDYLASLFISPFFCKIIKNSILRRILKQLIGKYGSYEYIISRTKLIDEFIENNAENIQQVLILGAGFDSRAIRFSDKLKHATIFELDSPLTQEFKRDKLKENNIEIPQNVKLIPINFNKESLQQKLDGVGFQKNQHTFFLLEGLIFYLDDSAVSDTFNIINQYACSNSIILFDYLYSSVIREENLYKGEKEVRIVLNRIGENYTFGIERDKIKDFLTQYSFNLIENFDSDKLSKKFFKKDETSIIPVIDIYGIAIANAVG